MTFGDRVTRAGESDRRQTNGGDVATGGATTPVGFDGESVTVDDVGVAIRWTSVDSLGPRPSCVCNEVTRSSAPPSRAWSLLKCWMARAPISRSLIKSSNSFWTTIPRNCSSRFARSFFASASCCSKSDKRAAIFMSRTSPS